MAGKFPGHFRLFAARGCTESVAGGRIDPRTWPPFGPPPLCWLGENPGWGKKLWPLLAGKTEKLPIELIGVLGLGGNGPADIFFHYLTAKCGQGKCTRQACLPFKPVQGADLSRTRGRLRPCSAQRGLPAPAVRRIRNHRCYVGTVRLPLGVRPNTVHFSTLMCSLYSIRFGSGSNGGRTG